MVERGCVDIYLLTNRTVKLISNSSEMKKKLKLPNGCSRRGAQMGRPNFVASYPEIHCKLQLQLVPMVDGGAYDRWGAYWGIGTPLYCAWGFPDSEPSDVEPEFIQIFIRAESRSDAKAKVREIQPFARFY